MSATLDSTGPLPLEPPRIVAWYRADPWPRMRRVLLTGPAVLALGGLVTAAAFLARLGDLRPAATLAGILLVAAGAIFTVVGMSHLLREDASLALRTDGVAVRAGGVETLVPWDDLAGVTWDAPRGELTLERAGGGPVTIVPRFAEVAGEALADRILQTRRKAAMGLLR